MNNLDLSEMSWTQYLTKLKLNSRKVVSPLIANLEITPRCNFNCKMCYVHLSDEEAKKIGNEHTTKQWIELGRQLLNAGTLLILLTGGEVFLRQDFREIYEAYCEMGFVLVIYSNGYLIDAETIEWLSKRPPMRLRITLYGASNETYEKVTGVKNAYDKIMHNIEMIMKADIPLALGLTIIEENKGDFENIRKFSVDNKLDFVYTSNIVKAVRGAHSQAESSRIKIIEEEREFTSEYDIKRSQSIYEVSPEAFGKCESRKCGFWITWDGKMSICAFIGSPCSFPFKTGFNEAWAELQHKLKDVKKPKECIGCKYEGFCAACPGIFVSETGYLDQTCESICEKAKALYEIYSLSYLKEINNIPQKQQII